MVTDEFMPPSGRTSGAEVLEADVPGRDSGRVLLRLFDTAGTERALPFVQNAVGYADADAILLVYSCDSTASFEDLQFWRNEVLREIRRPAQWALVGTRLDLFKEGDAAHVTRDTAEKQAGEWDMTSYQVSARTGEGVADVISALAKAV